MWTSAKSDFDYSLNFPQWWERDIEAMVAKDVNHPSVVLYSIGNEIPETGSPAGAAWGRKLAEKVRALDGTRYVTNAVNGMLAVLDDLAAIRSQAARGRRGQRRSWPTPSDMLNAISSSDLVTRRTAESLSVLDVAGINYAEARYVAGQGPVPEPDHRRQRDLPHPHRRQLAAGQAVLQRHRRLHLDGLGLPGRGRHRPSAVRGRGRHAALLHRTVPVPAGGLRRHRHHRSPQASLLLPADRLRPARPALPGGPAAGAPRQDVHRHARGRGATPSPAGPGPGSKARRSPSRSTATPTRWNSSSTAAPWAARPAGDSHRFRAEFEAVYEPGELLAVAYTGGTETGRHVLRSADGPVLLRAEADRQLISADGGDLAYVTFTLTDLAGTCCTGSDRPVRVEVTRPGRPARLRQRRPLDRGAIRRDRAPHLRRTGPRRPAAYRPRQDRADRIRTRMRAGRDHGHRQMRTRSPRS